MAQYAEITNIEVPDKAVAGSRVDVRVTIKNKASFEIGIMVGGALEYGVTPWPTITFPNNWANFPAGQSYYFGGYFTMPSARTKVHAYSYFYTAEGWVFDDEEIKTIEVAGVVGWYQADVKTISVTRGAELVEGWYEADVRIIYVDKGPALVEGWYQADVKTISVMRGAELVEGWYQADVKIISVTRPGEEPPDGEEGKFPWGVALIAAGGAVALAAAIPKKKTAGKKTLAKKKG